MDKMEIQILEDGTIKISADKISQASHASAEAFLREVARLGGGQTVRTRKAHAHTHSHEEEHEHDHGG